MKILEVLLEKLPENYVDAIANNMKDINGLYDESICFEIDFLSLFDWSESKEGYDFWEEVLEAIVTDKPLPKLPIQIEYIPSTYIVADELLYIMNISNTGIHISFDIDKSLIHKSTKKAKEKFLAWVN